MLKFSLHNPDLTTATRIAAAVNAYLGSNIAEASDPATVSVNVPANYPSGVVGLLTDVEQVKVEHEHREWPPVPAGTRQFQVRELEEIAAV